MFVKINQRNSKRFANKYFFMVFNISIYLLDFGGLSMKETGSKRDVHSTINERRWRNEIFFGNGLTLQAPIFSIL